MTASPGASRRIEGGGSVFTYSEAGAGTPLVLLHGIGSAARAFDDQLAGLSDRLRVIAWDAPGYGGSTCLVPESPVQPTTRRRSAPCSMRWASRPAT